MSLCKDLLTPSLPTTNSCPTVWYDIDVLQVHPKRDTFGSSIVHYLVPHCSVREAEWYQGTDSSAVLSQSWILCALRATSCLSSATMLWLAPLQLSSKSGISSLAARPFPLMDFLTKYPLPLSLSALTILTLPFSVHAPNLFRSAAASALSRFPLVLLPSFLSVLWGSTFQLFRLIFDRRAPVNQTNFSLGTCSCFHAYSDCPDLSTSLLPPHVLAHPYVIPQYSFSVSSRL